MAKKNTSRMVLKMTNSMLVVFVNIILYTILILLIVKAGGKAYSIAYRVFGSVSMETEGRAVTVRISEKESTMNVASKLELNRLIPDKYSFYLRTKLTGKEIIPGEYVLNTSMDYDAILSVLSTQPPLSP